MMRAMCLKLLAALVALVPAGAIACSVPADYRPPTNFELVQRAEVIALVRIESGDFRYRGEHEPSVRVRPVTLLKGAATPGDLGLPGLVGWEGKPVRPFVTSLSETHYSAFFGSCNRQIYPVGGLVLVFYTRSEGKLTPIGDPFSRSAEDVSGPDDLWVYAARHYLALQTGDPASLNDRVKADQAALLARPDWQSQAMALDLAGYLAIGGDTPRISYWAIWTTDPQQASVVAPFAPGDDSLVELDCSRRRAPSLYWSRPDAGPLALRVGSETFVTRRGATMHDKPDATVGDLVAPDSFVSRMLTATGPVAVLAGGKVAREGIAGDALYRWAQRCQAFRHHR
jgi:hypothetical protein